MDLAALTVLAKQIYNFVKPVFSSEVAGEISGDFKEATQGTMREIWAKIKPWFIIDDQDVEELQDVKTKPDDPVFEDAFISKLKAKLSKNEALQQELEAMLKKMENGDDDNAKVIIKNSKNINLGNISKVKGGVHIGDYTNKPKD